MGAEHARGSYCATPCCMHAIPPACRSQYGDFQITGCSDPDEYGWQVLGDAYVTQNFGVNLQDYDFM